MTDTTTEDGRLTEDAGRPNRGTSRWRPWPWAMVLLAAVLGPPLLVVEADLENEPIPSYVTTTHGEPTDELHAYAARVGLDPGDIELDVDAVGDLHDRGINPCTPGTTIPDDLAPGTPFACGSFDGHGGPAYPTVFTLIIAFGAFVVHRWRNRLGWYLGLAALCDLAGAAAGAFAVRDELQGGGSPVGFLAVQVGSLAWVVLLIVLLPLIILTIPSGRLRSARWRVVVAGAGALAVAVGAVQVFHPLQIGLVANPLRAPWAVSTADGALDILMQLWMLVMAGALLSLIVRVVAWLRHESRGAAQSWELLRHRRGTSHGRL